MIKANVYNIKTIIYIYIYIYIYILRNSEIAIKNILKLLK